MNKNMRNIFAALAAAGVLAAGAALSAYGAGDSTPEKVAAADRQAPSGAECFVQGAPGFQDLPDNICEELGLLGTGYMPAELEYLRAHPTSSSAKSMLAAEYAETFVRGSFVNGTPTLTFTEEPSSEIRDRIAAEGLNNYEIQVRNELSVAAQSLLTSVMIRELSNEFGDDTIHSVGFAGSNELSVHIADGDPWGLGSEDAEQDAIAGVWERTVEVVLDGEDGDTGISLPSSALRAVETTNVSISITRETDGPELAVATLN